MIAPRDQPAKITAIMAAYRPYESPFLAVRRFLATFPRMSLCLVCCTLLVGCATRSEPPPSLAAHLDALPNDNWLFQPDYREGRDPIHDLLTSQRRPAQPPSRPEARLADAALAFQGVRYRWGGTDPKTGFDCSGLIVYAARQSLGLKLPRRAADLASQGQPVQRDRLQVGDLVFFNTLGRRFSHVGIYVGDNYFVHAPSSGGVVRVADMRKSYWTKRYNGARRLDLTKLASTSPER